MNIGEPLYCETCRKGDKIPILISAERTPMKIEEKEIQEQVLAFVIDQYAVNRDEIDPERSLVDQGIIDSIGLIEISAFLEKTFSVSIEEKDMTRENFGSIVKMAHFVAGKK